MAEPQSLRLRPHAAPAIAASLAISVTRPGMIAHRIDWQRGGSRIAFADSHGAPSHPYAQRSSSRSPTRCAIVALRPRMCRTLRSDKELTLRADSARSLATDVRPLPGAFLPFGQRSLSAQLRRPRPQSATSAKRRKATFDRTGRMSAQGQSGGLNFDPRPHKGNRGRFHGPPSSFNVPFSQQRANARL